MTVYGAEVDYRGWVAVATSQSGRTPEIVTLISRLRRQGAVTVGITNDPDSPLADAVDVVMDLGAGEELAVPATKTFTTTTIAFAMLGEVWGPALPVTAWQTLPDAIRTVVDDPGPATAAIDLVDRAEEILCIGRGLAFGMALETALKVRETAGANAAAYSSADVRHGPLAAADQQDVALLLATNGAAGRNTLQLQDVLRARGVRQLLIGEVEGAELWTPAGLPEQLAVIPMAVRGQQLALLLAERRGLDPDQPHGLSKVTMT
jgi:glucosamine--fructose-6-phosphate aminotransferase (isomerizing)